MTKPELPPLERDPAHATFCETWKKLRQYEADAFITRLCRSHASAVILREIIYWLMPANCNPDLPRSTIYRNGHYWMARNQKQWLSRNAIDRDQLESTYKRASAFLVVDHFMFAAQRTTHYRIDYPALLRLLREHQASICDQSSQPVTEASRLTGTSFRASRSGAITPDPSYIPSILREAQINSTTGGASPAPSRRRSFVASGSSRGAAAPLTPRGTPATLEEDPEELMDDGEAKRGDISIYGQESNATTRRLAVMNLALRGIEATFGPEHADTFRRDLHPDLRADYVLANPPFNDSDWFRKDDDVRWTYGVPPKGNANFAWMQHFIHHLAPGGMAGFVLANGSMSSNQSGEGDIRRAIIEADLVDCMVALPGQLFYSTQIPVCLWFLTRRKAGDGQRRDRRGQTLFIDARKLGTLVDRVHRELTDADVQKIVGTYHAWRGNQDETGSQYEDVPGFCKSATTTDIKGHG